MSSCFRFIFAGLLIVCVASLVLASVLASTTYTSRLSVQRSILEPLDNGSESGFSGTYLLSNEGLNDPDLDPTYKFRIEREAAPRKTEIKAQDFLLSFDDGAMPTVLIIERETIPKRADFVPVWLWSRIQSMLKQPKTQITYQFIIPSWSMKGVSDI